MYDEWSGQVCSMASDEHAESKILEKTRRMTREFQVASGTLASDDTSGAWMLSRTTISQNGMLKRTHRRVVQAGVSGTTVDDTQ